ncbi:MAG: alpha/beta fold hydrolase [Anaerolineae bacterium]|nr:alpha/beta fold hydrolase [Anaerolineae bacterium]
MERPRDRYIQVGDINTRYWAEGSQGSPVILIHGLGGFIECWLLAIGALAAKYRVYAVDLPGHGRTGKPLDWPYRIIDLAGFVKDFMDTLGIDRAHLIGHSLGGATTARLATISPQMIDKMVLVSSAGLGKEITIGLRLCSIPLIGEILTRPSRSSAKRLVESLAHRPDGSTDELAEMVYRLTSLPGAHQAYLRTLRANLNLWGMRPSQYGPIVAGLSAMPHPVMIVWGKQDGVVPVAHAQTAADRLPNARVEIFDACGHIPMLEHPDTFHQLVLEFLADGQVSGNG